jgi:hypothetical protein
MANPAGDPLGSGGTCNKGYVLEDDVFVPSIAMGSAKQVNHAYSCWISFGPAGENFTSHLQRFTYSLSLADGYIASMYCRLS